MGNYRSPGQLLEIVLRKLEHTAELPKEIDGSAEVFNALVSSAWPRDGRAKHLSEQEIAERIAAITGRKFTRNQFQACFGKGRRLGGEKRYRQPVSIEIMRAYLSIAFTNWTVADRDFSPLKFDPPINMSLVIEHACVALEKVKSENRDISEIIRFLANSRHMPITLDDITFVSQLWDEYKGSSRGIVLQLLTHRQSKREF